MSTPVKTVEYVLKILKKYVSNEIVEKIISELKTVDGNKSFKDTIIRMENKWAEKADLQE